MHFIKNLNQESMYTIVLITYIDYIHRTTMKGDYEFNDDTINVHLQESQDIRRMRVLHRGNQRLRASLLLG